MSEIRLYGTKEFKDLNEMFRETVEKFGDRTSHWKIDAATGMYQPSKTYREFGHDVNCVKAALIGMGLQDKRIGIIGKNCCEWEESYLAGINGGAKSVVPLSTILKEDQIVNLARFAELGALFFTDEMASEILNLPERISTVKLIGLSGGIPEKDIIGFDELLSEGNKSIASGDSRFSDVKIDNQKESLLIFTTGTSGQSKGAIHSHRTLCSNIFSSQEGLEEQKYTEHDRTFSHLPESHVFGQVAEMLSRIQAGGSVAYNEGGKKSFVKELINFNPTLLHGVPAHCEPILNMLKAGYLTSLRLYVVGGSKANSEIMRKFEDYPAITAISGYGLTEHPIVMLNRPSSRRSDCSMGEPIEGLESKIIDVEGETSENPDVIEHGQVAIKGPSLFLGYYKNEEATRQALTEDGYFLTGDIVSKYSDGSHDLKKRFGDRMKNGAGNWMDFLRIEEIANSNPYIMESIASVAIPSDIPVTLVIYPDIDKIKADFGEDISDEKLLAILDEQRKMINNQLPRNEQIKFVEIVHSPLVRTPKGDIQRHKNLSQRGKQIDRDLRELLDTSEQIDRQLDRQQSEKLKEHI